jgi:hypothetical protein
VTYLAHDHDHISVPHDWGKPDPVLGLTTIFLVAEDTFHGVAARQKWLRRCVVPKGHLYQLSSLLRFYQLSLIDIQPDKPIECLAVRDCRVPELPFDACTIRFCNGLSKKDVVFQLARCLR